jgi:hypothetical protein
MKIKPSVNKNVTEAVKNCREVLVNETIGLLKQMRAEPGQDVTLGKALFLYQHKGNTTETVVCDRIAYAGREGSESYYIVSMGEDMYVPPRSDMFLTIDSLRTIYEEVRRVVREY